MFWLMITFHGKPTLLTSATLSQNTTASSEKLGNSFPPIPCLHCFNTLVYPYINYCAIIWADNNNFHRDSILLLQKRIVRKCTNSMWLEHTNPFSSPWIHLKFRIYILFKLVFSCTNSTIIYFLMTYLSQIISPWTMKFTITILVVPRTFV